MNDKIGESMIMLILFMQCNDWCNCHMWMRIHQQKCPKCNPLPHVIKTPESARTYAVLGCSILVKLHVLSLSHSNAKTECVYTHTA